MATVLMFNISLFAQTDIPTSKSEKLKKLREAMRGRASSERKSSAPLDATRNQDMWQRALQELTPKENAYSNKTEASSAVVRTQLIEAKDPVFNHGLQVGLTLQPYSPRGRVPMVSLGQNDLNRLESTWMPGFQIGYAPWESDLLGKHGVGLRFGASYARQAVDVYGPSGNSLGDTELHSLLTYGFLTQEWIFNRAPRWSWHADLGASRFDMLQTGQHTLAEASDSVWLALLRTGPSWRAGDFWFGLSYERRMPLSAGSWVRIDPDAVILGVQYGLR